MNDAHHELPILSDTECDAMVSTIDALREHWTARWPGLPFWTLGAASYLDAAQDGFDAYLERANAQHAILDAAFGDLYARVCSTLARILGAEVALATDLARPGFHIFDFHPDFMTNRASAHYDLQYDLIDWKHHENVDRDSQISFTLPVALPSSGGGLALWNLDWLDMRHLSEEQRRERIRANRAPTELQYHTGHMFVHGGHRLHQMMPIREGRPDDRRITLQGHAIRADSGWLVYW